MIRLALFAGESAGASLDLLFTYLASLEYKFDITLGDFIKASREAAEISQKVYTIYKIENFNTVSQKFINTIIQKTML